jgi:uncharacterized integral membrane protein
VRWFYLAVVLIFALAVLIFLFQNTQLVSVAFLAFAMSAPLALVVFVAYILGAATGGSLFALLRRSYAGYRRP